VFYDVPSDALFLQLRLQTMAEAEATVINNGVILVDFGSLDRAMTSARSSIL
jgi:hypothetical protein